MCKGIQVKTIFFFLTQKAKKKMNGGNEKKQNRLTSQGTIPYIYVTPTGQLTQSLSFLHVSPVNRVFVE
jgi:hypothetical protein